MPAIEFNQVKKQFEQSGQTIDALKETNLKIYSGEFVAIIGPSGSGKSTFLTLAGGLQQPTEGEIFINDRNVYAMKEKDLGKLRLNEIGFILQASNLVPYLKIKDQFILFDKITRKPNKELRESLFHQLGIESLANKYPDEISGGQRQRVAIAKALYNDPSVILADEPTASLDTDRAFEVVEILARESKERNKAIIMVTHDQRLIEHCDRVFVMTDGVLEEQSQ